MRRSRWSMAMAAGLCVIGSLLWSDAFGWDGVASGKIAEIHTLTEQGNYELRVVIVGAAQVCNNTNPALYGWAYMNSSDVNYKTVVANLMLAYTMGKTVTVYTMNDGNTGCHLHYVVLSG